MHMDEKLQARIEKIKMVLFDVDGVLTAGEIIFDDNGVESKVFNAQDGVGIKYLIRCGLKTGIITGRTSKAVEFRANELGITDVYQKALDKVLVFEKILKVHVIDPEEICYAGDDLADIPVLRRAGLAVAVENAGVEVKEVAHYITKRPGGKGAAREIAELILKAQNKWEGLMKKYLER